ncbi:MAG: hypothetical protein Q8N39_00790 [Pelolinea sp.]|nr:hypothetical protein [Pelolinea sp.]
MKNIISKIARLMVGYFLYGLGIVLTVNANQGLAPWSVFHQGLSLQLNITMGVATQVVGIVILVFDFIFGERLGWGTIGNVIFIGTFIDMFMLNNWIPIPNNIAVSYGMMVVGMAVMALATYSYLSAQLGAGPRDGLMIAMTKRINLSIGLIRNLIEVVVLVAGFFMGGSVGLGTLVMAILFGRFIQLTFKLFKFDVRQVKHRYIDQDFALIFNRLKNGKSE